MPDNGWLIIVLNLVEFKTKHVYINGKLILQSYSPNDNGHAQNAYQDTMIMVSKGDVLTHDGWSNYTSITFVPFKNSIL